MRIRVVTVVVGLLAAFALSPPLIFSSAAEPTPQPSATPVPGDEDEGGGLFDGIKDFVIHLVVPADDFFQTEYDKLDAKLKARLPFQTYITTIGRLKDVSAGLDGDASVLDIEFDYDGTPVKMDIGGLIAPHLPKFRPIVTGLYVLLIAFYNYRQVMHMIRGTNYGGIKDTVMWYDNGVPNSWDGT